MTELSDVQSQLQAELIGANVAFADVSTDTRSIKEGDLFVALTGPNFDGHDFLNQAKDAKAAAAIVSKNVRTDLPCLKVADTRKALGMLAKYHRAQHPIPIAAITGSCGKTTTKTMLAHILSQRAPTHVNKASFNNDIGVPLTLLGLRKEHQFAVSEMGANHPGEIQYTTSLVRPHVAVINNVAPAHLEGFGSVKGVATAKSEIFQGLDDDGIGVVNADDKFADYIREQVGNHKIITFGIQNQADVMARNVGLNHDGFAQFTLVTPKGNAEVTLPVIGEHNVMNALSAAAIAIAFDLTINEIKTGLETFEPVDMRLIRKKGHYGSLVLDDTYNANPLSFDAALHVLVHYPGESILVIGDMGELGERVREFHQEIGVKAKNLGVKHLLAVGEMSQLAVEAFGENGVCYPSHQALIADLLPHLKQDVTVLVKGSRRTQMERVVAAIEEK